MKVLLILLGLILMSYMFVFHAGPTNGAFKSYKTQWNKKYDNADIENFRMTIFFENVAKIEAHNATPGITYWEGINQFTDITQEEFVQTYLGELDSEALPSDNVFKSSGNFSDKDWTKEGAVSKIKDQGSCGSCWAFGTTGSLESLNFIYGTKTMELYSEQMLVDCAKECSGCGGGLRDAAYRFVIKNGLKKESEYPYVARDQKCKFETGEFKIKSYGTIKSGACDDLGAALEKRPTSVGVDASRWSSYSKGIFNNCGTNINHGVLLVAVSQTEKYWKIKNSWGLKWGEDGFIRLAYPGSTCAVCNRAYYPEF